VWRCATAVQLRRGREVLSYRYWLDGDGETNGRPTMGSRFGGKNDVNGVGLSTKWMRGSGEIMGTTWRWCGWRSYFTMMSLSSSRRQLMAAANHLRPIWPDHLHRRSTSRENLRWSTDRNDLLVDWSGQYVRVAVCKPIGTRTVRLCAACRSVSDSRVYLSDIRHAGVCVRSQLHVRYIAKGKESWVVGGKLLEQKQIDLWESSGLIPLS